MNTSKIAVLYKAVGYPSLMQLVATGDLADLQPWNRLAWRVGQLLVDEGHGLEHRASIKNMDAPKSASDEDEYFLNLRSMPKRVYAWALKHAPADSDLSYRANVAAGLDTYVIHLVQKPVEGQENEAVRYCEFAGKHQIETLLQGLQSYARKQQKQVKKIVAQLATYHLAEERRQELSRLFQGQWLGAEKALTTAARADEPKVPFLGDVSLTPEQRSQLRYWAVPQHAGMSAAFPAGTGIALKVITASNQLVNGAVYLWQAELGTPGEANYYLRMRLGRLDQARKGGRGWIPLFGDDDPTKDLYCEAQWLKKPDRNWEGTLMQVVAYTTQAPQLAPAIRQAVARPVLQAQEREVSYAVAA